MRPGDRSCSCVSLSPLWQWVKVKGGDRWADNPPEGRGPWGWERTGVGLAINSPRTPTPAPPSDTSQEMSSVSPDVTSPQNRPWGRGSYCLQATVPSQIPSPNPDPDQVPTDLS